MTHTPNAAARLVAIRMIAGDFVVGDDFVVPIYNVETTIWPEMDRDGTEPLVGTENEIGKLFEANR